MKPSDLMLDPGKGVGLIRFGDSLDKLADDLAFEPVSWGDGANRASRYNEELDVTVFEDDDDGEGIESVHCDSYLFYRQQNLVGMRFKDFVVLVGEAPDFGDIDYFDLDDGGGHFVFEFDRHGLQVWVRHQTLTVSTVIAHPIYDDED